MASALKDYEIIQWLLLWQLLSSIWIACNIAIDWTNLRASMDLLEFGINDNKTTYKSYKWAYNFFLTCMEWYVFLFSFIYFLLIVSSHLLLFFYIIFMTTGHFGNPTLIRLELYEAARQAQSPENVGLFSGIFSALPHMLLDVTRVFYHNSHIQSVFKIFFPTRWISTDPSTFTWRVIRILLLPYSTFFTLI